MPRHQQVNDLKKFKKSAQEKPTKQKRVAEKPSDENIEKTNDAIVAARKKKKQQEKEKEQEEQYEPTTEQESDDENVEEDHHEKPVQQKKARKVVTQKQTRKESVAKRLLKKNLRSTLIQRKVPFKKDFHAAHVALGLKRKRVTENALHIAQQIREIIWRNANTAAVNHLATARRSTLQTKDLIHGFYSTVNK